MSYTKDAQEWADQVGMALLRFNHAGEAEPVNDHARALTHATVSQAHQVGPTLPVWAIPIGCTAETAVKNVTPGRVGFRQVDRVVWIRRGFVPIVVANLDYTHVNVRGRRSAELFDRTPAAFELAFATTVGIPPSPAEMVQVNRNHVTVRARRSATDIIGMVQQAWDHHQDLRQPAAIERSRSRLASFGVPIHAQTLRVSVRSEFLMPFYAALIRGANGNRIAVAEGINGTQHSALTSLFTRHAPELLDELHAGWPVS